MALISTRSYFEEKGYKVDYDPKTGNIRVYDPKTMHSSMIEKGAYTVSGGRSSITPDVAKQVESMIASGKYTLPSTSSSGSTTTEKKTKKESSGGATSGLASGVTTTPKQDAVALRDYFESRGYTVDYVPQTGNINIKAPGAPEISLSPAEYTLYGERAYISPDDVTSGLRNLEREIREADVNTAPLYAKALDEYLGLIDKYEAQLIDAYQKQMGGVDPATILALASLKETVKRQRESLLEEMSRRGLLHSGLWLEAEERLNRGELTAQQQILASRLSDLQNQLNQALMNFTSARLGAMRTYGLEGIQAAERESLARQQQLENELQRALDEAYRRKMLSLQEFQTYAPYMQLTEAQRQTLPMEWSQLVGEVATGPGTENVPVRSYVGTSGTVGYDSSTGEVIINGVRIRPSDVGGYISAGTAYLPRNIIDGILNRY